MKHLLDIHLRLGSVRTSVLKEQPNHNCQGTYKHFCILLLLLGLPVSLTEAVLSFHAGDLRCNLWAEPSLWAEARPVWWVIHGLWVSPDLFLPSPISLLPPSSTRTWTPTMSHSLFWALRPQPWTRQTQFWPSKSSQTGGKFTEPVNTEI